MPTHAELASKLLGDAASFFRSLAAQNQEIEKEMSENASVFERVSALLEESPMGSIQDKSHAQLAAKLLLDAASFFRRVGDGNDPLREQMYENAAVFTHISQLVSDDPLGLLD